VTRDAGRDLEFDLSGVGIRLTALPESIASRLETEWEPFASVPVGAAVLDLGVEAVTVATLPGRFDPKAMRSEVGADRARYEMPDGRVELDERGTGRIELRVGDESRAYFAFANFVRAALAWRMLSRGGALLHAAGIVHRERAFVLVGAAGAGKSTWAGLAEQAGAAVLSDDLVLLDGERGGVEALGAPFRSTHRRTSGPGRWPLAAILFPDHGSRVRLAPVTAIEAHARVLANLPFVVEAVGRDPRVSETTERLVSTVPARLLTFGRDATFLEALESFTP
jgi:hypothetical protein